MNETIEGVVREIQRWSNDKGGDVLLEDEEFKLYYEGKMDIPIGQSCSFEVCRGEGERKNDFEVLNCEILRANPQHGLQIPEQQKVPERQPVPPPEKGKHVMIPSEQFGQIVNFMNMKSKINEGRKFSLDMAVKTYQAMNCMDKSHIAVAERVITIAKRYEGYLV